MAQYFPHIVHASDSVDTAKHEISLYFSDKEVCPHPMPDEHWLI